MDDKPVSGTDIFGNPVGTNIQGNPNDKNVQGDRAQDSEGNNSKDIFGNETGNG